MKKFNRLLMVFTVLIMFGCSSDGDDSTMPPPNNGPIENDITYTDDVAPIMAANCTSCHGNPPTNNAPFPLTTFADVNNRSSSIFSQMNSGTMPPTGRLPQSVIDVIEAWIDGGKKQ